MIINDPSEAGVHMTADEVLIDRIRLLVKRCKGVDERSLDEWVTRGIAYARTLPSKDAGSKASA